MYIKMTHSVRYRCALEFIRLSNENLLISCYREKGRNFFFSSCANAQNSEQGQKYVAKQAKDCRDQGEGRLEAQEKVTNSLEDKKHVFMYKDEYSVCSNYLSRHW